MSAKRLRSLLAVFLLLSALPALAGGPRFIAPSTSTTPGAAMAWRSDQPLQYFTDPGNLNASVTHAQADAIVAAAAAVWNVPTSSLTLVQGGALAEHVSAANTSFDSNGVAFPADVAASNYQSKPIAVIYDSDGSVIDLLMGAGASDPSSCRQNEVVESVDSFGNNATIQHAVLVINGRCVGSSQDQLLQLQYMLMRSIGRVIGLGWSQLNDNVFTGVTTPTPQQMAHWPVMHPMDVLCGPYTYLCMVDPFRLRDDDLSALAGLYPVTASNLTTGKTLSAQGALVIGGYIVFPNNMGMDMVNVVVRRWANGAGAAEPWETASGLTGLGAVKNTGNPVSGPEDPADDAGNPNDQYASWGYGISRVPLPDNYITIIDIDPINPLYSGAYALGPFQRPPVTASGTFPEQQDWDHASVGFSMVAFKPTDAPSGCWTLGSETRPQAADPTGWWTGLVCGPTHPAWGQVTVRAGHTWTLETTAVDETMGRTIAKLQPVMGVWKSTDPIGTLPTVAADPIPMNAASPGMSQLTVDADSGNSTYRFTTADAWGGGRPDFYYKARLLYADTVLPALVPTAGGQITITGMGFASGNRVTVNGVAAKVVSWTANQIVAIAPSMTVARALGGTPVEVAVLDAQTGGSTRMTGALSYPGTGALQLVAVSAPPALETGVTAATPFAVKVLAADGVTPVAGASVRFAVVSGGAQLMGCGSAASCTLTANALGIAQSTVTGLSAGNVILSATEVTGGVTVQASVVDADPVRSALITTPTAYVAAGGSASFPVTLQAVQDGLAAANVPVSWTTAQGVAVSISTSATGASGAAAVTVSSNALAAGSATVQGCAWSTVCASWTLVSVAASQWLPAVVSGAGQSVTSSAVLAPVVLRVTDPAGHPLAAAAVSVAQTVYGWQGACPASGRCPAAPVLATQRAAGVTDANGLVTVSPLQVAGVPQTVDVAVSSGTTGFVSLTLVKTP